MARPAGSMAVPNRKAYSYEYSVLYTVYKARVTSEFTIFVVEFGKSTIVLFIQYLFASDVLINAAVSLSVFLHLRSEVAFVS